MAGRRPALIEKRLESGIRPCDVPTMRSPLGLILLTAAAACAPPPSEKSGAADNAAATGETKPPAGPAPAGGPANAAAASDDMPADKAPSPPPNHYSAHGQEPGWLVTIADRRIDYTGNYGEKTISVAQPAPRMTGNGYRYEAGRLIIAIDRGRCNDAMSGQGFADTVTVRADGETYLGCGGARRPGWDM